MTTISLKSGMNRKTVKNRKMRNHNGGFLGSMLANDVLHLCTFKMPII